MKRKDLVKFLESKGFELKRHGAEHDVYCRNKDTEIIPRHSEINEMLARSVIKRWSK